MPYIRADRLHVPHPFKPGQERQGNAHTVLTGNGDQIGRIDGRGQHAHTHFVRLEVRRDVRFERDHILWWAKTMYNSALRHGMNVR